MRSKGQFMIISSVVIALIVISAGAMISETRTKEYSNNDLAYTIETLKYEADKVDMTDPNERDSFKTLVDMIAGYRADAVYWRSQQCFNVTLEDSRDRVKLSCIG